MQKSNTITIPLYEFISLLMSYYYEHDKDHKEEMIEYFFETLGRPLTNAEIYDYCTEAYKVKSIYKGTTDQEDARKLLTMWNKTYPPMIKRRNKIIDEIIIEKGLLRKPRKGRL